MKKKYGDKIDLPEDRVFVGFDAYQKAIAAGSRRGADWPPRPVSAPSIMRRPSPPASTSSWRSRAASTPPASAPCWQTNKLADEKNLKVVVGLQRRYQASYLNGIKKIHDGKIGDVILCRAYWNGGEPGSANASRK